MKSASIEMEGATTGEGKISSDLQVLSTEQETIGFDI